MKKWVQPEVSSESGHERLKRRKVHLFSFANNSDDEEEEEEEEKEEEKVENEI